LTTVQAKEVVPIASERLRMEGDGQVVPYGATALMNLRRGISGVSVEEMM
jgi:hypothetical protein